MVPMKTAKCLVQNRMVVLFSILLLLGCGKLMGGDSENADANVDAASRVKIYTKQIELRPNDPAGYAYRGEAYHKLGDYTKALADYSAALNLKPDNFVAFALYCNRGFLEEERGLLTAAKADYEAAVKLNMYPGDFTLLMRQGNLLGRMEDPQGASVSFSAAIELAPSDCGGYLGRSHARAELEEFDGALADSVEAIKLSPNNPRCHDAHGIVLMGKRDYAAAIQALTKAIELSDNKAAPLCNRAAAYAQTGDFDNALKDLNQILALKPDFSGAQVLIGDICFTQGKLSEALAAYRKASPPQKDGKRYGGARIRRDLLALRLEGITPQGELVDQPEEVPTGNWGKSIERYLRGQLSEKEFLTEATKAPPHLTQTFRVAAYFYIGELALIRKDFQKALHSFGECTATENPNLVLYQLAKAEYGRTSTVTGNQ